MEEEYFRDQRLKNLAPLTMDDSRDSTKDTNARPLTPNKYKERLRPRTPEQVVRLELDKLQAKKLELMKKQKEINNRKVRLHKIKSTLAKFMDEKEVCSICQDTFDLEVHNFSTLECHHWFHQACVGKWFEKQRKCPICKSLVTEVTNVAP